MNPNLYVRRELPGIGAAVRGTELLATWRAERDALAGIVKPDHQQAYRLIALAGKVARADPTANLITDREIVAIATSVCDRAGWRTRLSGFVENDDGDLIALIDELDALELIRVTAERAGLPVSLPDFDADVKRLIDELGRFPKATDYARVVGTILRPDLLAIDPMLARTTEKFVALLDIAEALHHEETDFRPLQLPAIKPVDVAPIKPGRIPELPAEFVFKAGTAPPEIPPTTPYQWRSPDGREAFLVVPSIPPPDRTLTLLVTRAENLVGKRVLLGGLRGVIAEGVVVKFDWNDIAAIGEKVEYLVVGSGEPWRCLTRGS